MVENLIGLGHNIVETLLLSVCIPIKEESRKHILMNTNHYQMNTTLQFQNLRSERMYSLLAIQIIQIERIIFSAIFQDIFSYSQKRTSLRIDFNNVPIVHCNTEESYIGRDNIS